MHAFFFLDGVRAGACVVEPAWWRTTVEVYGDTRELGTLCLAGHNALGRVVDLRLWCAPKCMHAAKGHWRITRKSDKINNSFEKVLVVKSAESIKQAPVLKLLRSYTVHYAWGSGFIEDLCVLLTDCSRRWNKARQKLTAQNEHNNGMTKKRTNANQNYNAFKSDINFMQQNTEEWRHVMHVRHSTNL